MATKVTAVQVSGAGGDIGDLGMILFVCFSQHFYINRNR